MPARHEVAVTIQMISIKDARRPRRQPEVPIATGLASIRGAFKRSATDELASPAAETDSPAAPEPGQSSTGSGGLAAPARKKAKVEGGSKKGKKSLSAVDPLAASDPKPLSSAVDALAASEPEHSLSAVVAPAASEPTPSLSAVVAPAASEPEQPSLSAVHALTAPEPDQSLSAVVAPAASGPQPSLSAVDPPAASESQSSLSAVDAPAAPEPEEQSLSAVVAPAASEADQSLSAVDARAPSEPDQSLSAVDARAPSDPQPSLSAIDTTCRFGAFRRCGGSVATHGGFLPTMSVSIVPYFYFDTAAIRRWDVSIGCFSNHVDPQHWLLF